MARTTTAVSEKELNELLTRIATTQISAIDTLEEQGRDDLDWVEVSVWNLKDALTAAYLAGQRDAQAGRDGIAWEGNEVELYDFCTGKVTGQRFANAFAARTWIKEYASDQCLTYRPTAN